MTEELLFRVVIALATLPLGYAVWNWLRRSRREDGGEAGHFHPHNDTYLSTQARNLRKADPWQRP